MAANTASWSIPKIAATNLHDAVVEFENTNSALIEKARVEGKAGIWFVVTDDLKTIMQSFIHGLRSKYPTGTFISGHPIVVLSSRKHVPLPGFTNTGYVVLRSKDLEEGSFRWGEEDLEEGCYIPLGMK